MVALGMCNLFGSFVSSMPITASFTRTAINNASGARTTLGGIVTGVLVLLTLGFLTDAFYYIPKATLAAIIISAMIFLFHYEKPIEIWKAKSKIAVIMLKNANILSLIYFSRNRPCAVFSYSNYQCLLGTRNRNWLRHCFELGIYFI